MSASARRFDKPFWPALGVMIAVSIAARAALIFHAPRPFGYVWDLYHEGVIWTRAHGAFPKPADCGECYHPPLYFACGVPLYSLGAAATGTAASGLRALALFSTLCAGFVVYYCWKTLRLLRQTGGALLLGTGLALALPCLFISSFAAENDALLAALMTAFFYHLCRRVFHPARADWKNPVLLGVLAGLSALTKYSGWLALGAAVLTIGPRLFLGKKRAARDLGIVAALAVAICGWHYAKNLREYHKLFPGPYWAPNLFEVDARAPLRSGYDFHTLKIKEVADLYRETRPRALAGFPVYASVLSTLHAQAWTDMSFFSVPGRHGWMLPAPYAADGPDVPPVASTPPSTPREAPYPAKRVSIPLIELVLRLGLIPTILALFGFFATLRRKALRPFAVFSVLTVAVYVCWLSSQSSWTIKTKYVLFLLPVYAAYAVLGLRVLQKRDRRLGWAATAAFTAALLAAEAYCWAFALG